MRVESSLWQQMDLLLNDPFRAQTTAVPVSVSLVTGASFSGNLRGVYQDGLSLTASGGITFVALHAIASVVFLDAESAAATAPASGAGSEQPRAGSPERRGAFRYATSVREASDMQAPPATTMSPLAGK